MVGVGIDEHTFGGILRQLRKDRSLSQQELAQAAGVSVRTLTDLECGKVSRPRFATLRSLADALGLDPAERRHLLAPLR